MAADAERPLFVLFTAEWCMWCAVLEEVALADTEVADSVRQFTPVAVNAELFLGDTMKRYGLRGYPSAVILDAAGHVVARVEGFHPASRYADKIRDALQSLRERPIRQSAR